MTYTTTKIKSGTITLPKKLKNFFEGEEVIILSFEDGIYVKKIFKPSLKDLRPKLLKFGRMISKKDLQDAIRQTRNKSKQV